MLKSLTQPRSSPVSSPRFHYAPAQLASTSPPQRRLSKSKDQEILSTSKPPHAVHYVDAGTQWSPVMSSKMNESPPPPEPKRVDVRQPTQPETLTSTVPSTSPHVPAKPALKPESSTMKKRQSPDEAVPGVSSAVSSFPKRARSAQEPVKVLPARYEFCEVEDMVIIIANMISELIQTNDELPLRSGVLTRFHSRTPPGISVLDYLQRLAKHATLTPPLLLSMVYYIDRLCSLYPAFTINTLTVHRFLITAATVAAKGLSDSFWNNSTYARVGGIKIAELGLLELEFLYRVDWKIVPNPEVLVDYYRGLVERSEGYEVESDNSSSDEEEEGDEIEDEMDTDNEMADGQTGKSEGATDKQWKAWMEDVSTKRAGVEEALDRKEEWI